MFKEAFLLSLLIHNAFPDCQCGLRREFEGALIHGGKDAQPHCEYPWQAFILKFQNGLPYGCGGSIINNEWILTAAHCLPSSSTLNNQGFQSGILVRVGRVSNADWDSVFQPWINYWSNIGPRPELSTLGENGLFLVDRLVSHQEYPNTISADIGLIHVQTPFNFSDTARPVCLEGPNSAPNINHEAELSGWGYTSDSYNRTDHLQRATVRQVFCPSNNFFDPMRQMCFNRGSPGGCQGDSGSPYVAKKRGRFYQIAVSSLMLHRLFDKPCSEKDLERIGVRVAYFYDWIKKMANSGTWCSP